MQKRILEVLGGRGRPMSAYDMLSAIVGIEGKPIYPNQVYGALGRLAGANLVDRVESLSAYVLRREQSALMLVCTACGAALQADGSALHDALFKLAEQHAFKTRRTIIEASGRCGPCGALHAGKTCAADADPSRPGITLPAGRRDGRPRRRARASGRR